MATKEDYPKLVEALEAGPLQPWQRDASGPDRPEVGARACVACMMKRVKELKGLKHPAHTC